MNQHYPTEFELFSSTDPMPPIYTQALLHSGSCFDPKDREGMAHFIEHMIVNGSPKFPSKDLLSEHIESVGGVMGAATNPEIIMVNTEVPDKEDFGRVVDIFEATLCNPLMDEAVFETEKNVVIKEITKSQSNPEKTLLEATSKLLFSNTSFEHRALGSMESVSSITYEEMLGSHNTLFNATRITFIASGDISIDEITRQLDSLPFKTGNPFEKDSTRIETQSVERKNSIFMDLKQTSIFVGFYNAPVFSKEALCIALAGNILASGRTSRLVKILRYKKGLIYTIYPSSYIRLPQSIYGVTTDTSEDKVQIVIDEILKEMKHFNEHGVTEKELDFMKNKLVKSLKRSLQTSSSWVDFHAYGEAFGPNQYRPVNKYAEVVSEITLEEINNAIRKYISPDRMYVSLAGKVMADDIHL